MKTLNTLCFVSAFCALLSGGTFAAEPASPNKPTLYIIGDSTGKN